MGTSVTFLIFAGILLVLSAIYFIASKIDWKKIKKLPVAVLIFILCCVFGHSGSFAFWTNNLTYEGESVYNYLQVYEDDKQIYLSTNVLFGVQSVYVKNETLTGMYYDYAMAAPLMADIYNKDSSDILILGMGTGTYATQCKKYFADKTPTIEGVEIDEKITALSKKYFNAADDVKVTTYDGRAYLNAVKNTYDVIMVDAYQDITIPFQMSSKEFFTLVKEHLKPDGVMVVNMNMRGGGEGNINQYLSDTISTVFPEVFTVDVSNSSNRVLFASDNAKMTQVFDNNLARVTDTSLYSAMYGVKTNYEKYSPTGKYILTDDKAPVELLGMKVVDRMISDELSYYKEIFKKEGLKGLLSSF